MDPTHDDFGNPIPTVSEWFGGRQPAVSDGQRIAELEAALHRINALNDSPARFNSEIQDVLNSVIDTSDTKF